MTPRERKAQKTKLFLEEGLLQLMKEKNIKNITVRELTERVNINRSTFYLHYMDIFDMVEKIEQKLIDMFYEELEADSKERSTEEDVYHFMESAISFLQKHRRTFLILCGKNGDHSFLDRLVELTYRHANVWIRSILEEKTNLRDVEHATVFFCNGCVAILASWLKNEEERNTSEILQLMFQLVLNGANGFLADNGKMQS